VKSLPSAVNDELLLVNGYLSVDFLAKNGIIKDSENLEKLRATLKEYKNDLKLF
jgi:hypothetical protein